MDRLAREMSAVTRVIVILETEEQGLLHSRDFHYLLFPHKKCDTEETNQNLPAFKSMF